MCLGQLCFCYSWKTFQLSSTRRLHRLIRPLLVKPKPKPSSQMRAHLKYFTSPHPLRGFQSCADYSPSVTPDDDNNLDAPPPQQKSDHPITAPHPSTPHPTRDNSLLEDWKKWGRLGLCFAIRVCFTHWQHESNTHSHTQVKDSGLQVIGGLVCNSNHFPSHLYSLDGWSRLINMPVSGEGTCCTGCTIFQITSLRDRVRLYSIIAYYHYLQ